VKSKLHNLVGGGGGGKITFEVGVTSLKRCIRMINWSFGGGKHDPVRIELSAVFAYLISLFVTSA
jgi:hypothetical protein